MSVTQTCVTESFLSVISCYWGVLHYSPGKKKKKSSILVGVVLKFKLQQAELYGNSIFNFSRNRHTFFHHAFIFHFLQSHTIDYQNSAHGNSIHEVHRASKAVELKWRTHHSFIQCIFIEHLPHP